MKIEIIDQLKISTEKECYSIFIPLRFYIDANETHRLYKITVKKIFNNGKTIQQTIDTNDKNIYYSPDNASKCNLKPACIRRVDSDTYNLLWLKLLIQKNLIENGKFTIYFDIEIDDAIILEHVINFKIEDISIIDNVKFKRINNNLIYYKTNFIAILAICISLYITTDNISTISQTNHISSLAKQFLAAAYGSLLIYFINPIVKAIFKNTYTSSLIIYPEFHFPSYFINYFKSLTSLILTSLVLILSLLTSIITINSDIPEISNKTNAKIIIKDKYGKQINYSSKIFNIFDYEYSSYINDTNIATLKKTPDTQYENFLGKINIIPERLLTKNYWQSSEFIVKFDEEKQHYKISFDTNRGEFTDKEKHLTNELVTAITSMIISDNTKQQYNDALYTIIRHKNTFTVTKEATLKIDKIRDIYNKTVGAQSDKTNVETINLSLEYAPLIKFKTNSTTTLYSIQTYLEEFGYLDASDFVQFYNETLKNRLVYKGTTTDKKNLLFLECLLFLF